MIGFRGYRGFGDDGTGWSDPYSIGTSTPTTSPAPLVSADSTSSNVTAGSVLTSAVGVGSGLVNIFGQSQANAALLAQQQLAMQNAVSPAVIVVGAIGGLLVVGLLIHSMHKGGKKSRRTAGYRRK